MKRSLVLPALLLVALAALLAGCTSPQAVPPVTPAVTATATPAMPSTCGFTTCHGADLACGETPPRYCTMDFQLGDKCRQYASCSSANGSCSLITTPQYESCRACIQKCAGSDAGEIFACQEKC